MPLRRRSAKLVTKVIGEERMAVENAVSDLKTVLEMDDKDAIDAKTAALGEASAALAQKLYAEQAAEAVRRARPSAERR